MLTSVKKEVRVIRGFCAEFIGVWVIVRKIWYMYALYKERDCIYAKKTSTVFLSIQTAVMRNVLIKDFLPNVIPLFSLHQKLLDCIVSLCSELALIPSPFPFQFPLAVGVRTLEVQNGESTPVLQQTHWQPTPN